MIRKERDKVAYTVSTLAEFAGIREAIKESLNFWDQDQGGRLFIAVNEAVNNALVHGTRQQGDKHVNVSIAKEEDCLTIVIRQDGTGIGQRKPADKPVDPWAERGRGLSIIRNFTDSAEFNDRGTELVLRKKLKSGPCG